MWVLSVLCVPGLGSSVLSFLMRSFCIWSVQHFYCTLMSAETNATWYLTFYVEMGRVMVSCFVLFSVLTHKGNLYIIVIAVLSIYFHNELCGSECNFLHVCEQGRYRCFVWHQTPLGSDVFMLKELTYNVDSIRPHHLRGSLGNTSLLYEAMHVFFKSPLQFVSSTLFIAIFLGGCVYMCECVWKWLRNITAFVCVCVCVLSLISIKSYWTGCVCVSQLVITVC